MDKPLREMRLGELLVKLGYLNEVQLGQVLAAQEEQKSYRPFGEICKELGFVSAKELRDILLKYRKEILLGELLLRLGAISDSQLYEALREQKQTGMKLGNILVNKGYINPTALVDALCITLGIARLHPAKDLIDKELLNKASMSYFQKQRVIPLSFDREKRIVKVVMEDPTDSMVIGDLQKMFGADVEPVICPPGEIDRVLSRAFDVWAK